MNRMCIDIAPVAGMVLLTLAGSNTCHAQSNSTGNSPAMTSTIPLTSSIVPIPPPTGPNQNAEELTPQSRNRTLDLQFSLSPKNEAELQKRVNAGEQLTPAELAKYQGDPQSAKIVADWLRSQGFKNVKIASDNSAIFTQATVDQVEKSLQVKMQSVVVNGTRAVSAITPPQLPVPLAESVTGVQGLQPWIRAQRKALSRKAYEQMKIYKHEEASPSPSSDAPSPIPAGPSRSATIPHPPRAIPGKQAFVLSALKIADVLRTYNADRVGTSGRGQTIAILIDTPPNRADLTAFWAKNGLKIKDQQVQFIDVRAPGAKFPAPEGEESLDVEWASGIAPGAIVKVYTSGSLNYVDLDRALRRILDDARKPDGPRHVSISLGLREDMVSDAEIQTEHLIFLALAALGVNVFVSSGDAGSNPDQTGHGKSQDVRVEYAASDPQVIAVGGTSLGTSGKGPEVCWEQSGGGVSARALTEMLRPAWQASYPSINSQYRLVPDVSSVADPVPGGLVVLNGNAVPYGGTSWSAPVWAGFSALLGEKVAKTGKSMGFIGRRLYESRGQGAFRDVGGTSNGAYQCHAGWNPVTGLGSPDIAKISQLLTQ